MQGLSSHEAQARLTRYGENRLPEPKETSILVIFLRQFKSPFIYVLLLAAVVSWFLEHRINSLFIAVVLLLNALIGSIQEYSAARSAKALRKMVPYFTAVYRDGVVQKIETHLLVPGDIVQLVSGDKVPADIKLLQSHHLSCDESLLTGESLPQAKSPSPAVPLDAPLNERHDALFAGTLVSQGRGTGEVTGTGLRTQLGQIVQQVAVEPGSKPPLMTRVEAFTHKISLAVLLIIVLLFIVGMSRGEDIGQMFLMAVALAVSAIPEGLPAAITIALAIGMRRMAKCGVIVRKLLAVEALGSCTFIASDKTGTLTMNEMTITDVILSDGLHLKITGEGLDLHGDVQNHGSQVAKNPAFIQLVLSGALANEAQLNFSEGQWRGEGDKVDLAFLVLAAKLDLYASGMDKRYPQQSLLPYESENAYCASINRVDEQWILSVKGSTERLLTMCNEDCHGRPLNKQQLVHATRTLAQKGFRVLAVACKALDEPTADITQSLHQLRLMGLVGMRDPVRPGVKEAIGDCESADIEMAMITGDHPDTALSVARELGFRPYPHHAITGAELKTAEDNQALDALIKNERVFARIEPQQKLALVKAWQRYGHFVAVTGDGVNDAPALRHAHVGVAMGKRGTDVARESADLIITDDNFSSLVEGIRQGRIVYNNIRKVVFLLLSTGAAEIVLFILSVLMELPLPLLPVQLLWLNLVTNGLQDVALAFEPAEGDELKRPPRQPKEPIFDFLMIRRVLANALVMGAVAFAIFYLALEQGMPVDQARNRTLLLMVLFENIHIFNSRSETRSLFRQRFFSNPLLLFGMLAAQSVHILAMHVPFLAQILMIAPVSLVDWGHLLLLASVLLLTDELHKYVIRAGKGQKARFR